MTATTPIWLTILVAVIAPVATLVGVRWTLRAADRRSQMEADRRDRLAREEADRRDALAREEAARADQRSKLEAELRVREIRDTARDERLFAIYVDLLTVASQIAGRSVDELDTDGAWEKANRAFMQPAMRARVLAHQAVIDAAGAFSNALTAMRPIDDMGHAEMVEGLAAISTAVKGLHSAIRAELGLPDLEHRTSPKTLDLSALRDDS